MLRGKPMLQKARELRGPLRKYCANVVPLLEAVGCLVPDWLHNRPAFSTPDCKPDHTRILRGLQAWAS